MGDDEITKRYSVNALPVTYLIDRRGRIAATYVGVVDRANIEANIKTLAAETLDPQASIPEGWPVAWSADDRFLYFL